jgi:hypothetical protein
MGDRLASVGFTPIADAIPIRFAPRGWDRREVTCVTTATFAIRVLRVPRGVSVRATKWPS